MKPLMVGTIAAITLGTLPLSAPSVLAQGGGAAECGPGQGVPCRLPDGEMITPPLFEDLPLCAGNESAFPCRTDTGDVLADAVEAQAAPSGDDTPAAGIAEGGGDTANAEAPPAETAETAGEPAPAEAAENTGQAAPATGDDTPTADGAAASGETAPDQEAPETVPEAEVVSADEAAQDSPAGGGETGTAAKVVEVEAAPAAADSTESASDTVAGADAAETAEVSGDAAPEAGEATLAEQTAAEETLIVDEAPAAAAAASAPINGDAARAEAGVVVEEQAVTSEEVRSSAQDFETSASASAAAPAKDDGLSNFERAILLGLGAVAVGQLLDTGEEVVSNTGDRVVVQRGDRLRILKDDSVLLRQPGSQIRTETFSDGSTREIVTREDGARIVTIKAADGRVLRRARVLEDGSQVVLFDDTVEAQPVETATLPEPTTPAVEVGAFENEAELQAALAAAIARDLDRSFSLRQIRDIRDVRHLAPEINVDAINFETGSAAIRPSEARELATLGRAMRRMIVENPREVFLIEGHTDAVGNAASNLALSDRRAESVALALTEYFDVPPENLVVQGYGESDLKVPTLEAERANRRATVRRISPLLDRDFAQQF